MVLHRTPGRRAAFALLAGTVAQALAASPEAPVLAMRDPTQPPSLVAPALAAAPAAGGVAAVAPVWPRLQAVKVSATGGSSALIDGRVVRVGERVGALTLVTVDAQGVLLRGARFDQQLALFPGIVKVAATKVLR